MPKSGPLNGLLVVDLSRALAGPQATMMMGDLGARIIKVEVPDTGDDTRGWGPPFRWPQPESGTHSGVPGRDAQGRESTYFLSANRNKESIVLDLKQESERALLLELVTIADVLVENFRTGVLERLGLGLSTLHDLNPRLVILSITGFGHDGPEGGRAGYDQIAQGEGGLMSLTGPAPDDPQKVGTPIADLLAGMYGAFGVLAALREREESGVGSIVRTSLLSAVVGVHGFQGTRWTVAGELGQARGNHHSAIAPYGLFRCADGAVQIAVGSEKLWRDFCEGFDLDPMREPFTSNGDRAANLDVLIAYIEEVFSGWPAADLLEHLSVMGIPAGRVRSIDQVYDWEQTRSQGLLIDVEHATLGPLQLPGPPLRFFDTLGAETTARGDSAPPILDQHGEVIRSWIEDRR